MCDPYLLAWSVVDTGDSAMSRSQNVGNASNGAFRVRDMRGLDSLLMTEKGRLWSGLQTSRLQNFSLQGMDDSMP